MGEISLLAESLKLSIHLCVDLWSENEPSDQAVGEEENHGNGDCQRRLVPNGRIMSAPSASREKKPDEDEEDDSSH